MQTVYLHHMIKIDFWDYFHGHIIIIFSMILYLVQSLDFSDDYGSPSHFYQKSRQCKVTITQLFCQLHHPFSLICSLIVVHFVIFLGKKVSVNEPIQKLCTVGWYMIDCCICWHYLTIGAITNAPIGPSIPPSTNPIHPPPADAFPSHHT